MPGKYDKATDGLLDTISAYRSRLSDVKYRALAHKSLGDDTETTVDDLVELLDTPVAT